MLVSDFAVGERSVLASVPTSSGVVSLRTVACATALLALSTTEVQAFSVGMSRLEAGSACVPISTLNGGVASQVRSSLAEIKRSAGLTWGEIALIFDVSRQTIHAWMGGNAVRPFHAAKVQAKLEVVRGMQGEPAYKIRQNLLKDKLKKQKISVYGSEESPILISDKFAFSHHLEVRSLSGKN